MEEKRRGRPRKYEGETQAERLKEYNKAKYKEIMSDPQKKAAKREQLAKAMKRRVFAYLTEEDHAKLQRLADSLGITAGELAKNIISEYLKNIE